MKSLSKILAFIACTATAMVGHTIHHNLFWAVVDFIFAPVAWSKWLICHEVTVTLIRETFSFFLS